MLFAAARAGLISINWIRHTHEVAREQAAATGFKYANVAERWHKQAPIYYRVLEQAMGVKQAKAFKPDKQQVPARGDLVFFDGFDHVALATGEKTGSGEHEVLSLWTLPLINGRAATAVQKTTIEACDAPLSSKVTFGAPPW